MPYEIKSLSIQGDGIADGPVYAPFSLPGELVEGDLIGNRIEAPRIVRALDQRVKAPCSHFKSCGGCAMQHASDTFVSEWKSQIIVTALESHNISTVFRPTITSPQHSRRRATLAGKRTKNGAMVGFHARASGVIIPIPNCTLLHPAIMTAIPALEKLTVIGTSRKAELSVAVGVSLNGLDINVTNGVKLDAATQLELAQLVEANKFARLTWNGDPIAIRSPAVFDINSIHVIPPPGAFMQATEAGQLALIETVLEITSGAKSVIDLFAGCGTFSLPVARSMAVHSVENEKLLLDALTAAWRKSTGLKPLTTEKRDLFRNPLLPEDLPYDAAIIDPPRAGAQAQSQMLANSDIPCIAFVSCSPVTFARDAKILIEAGYELEWVQPIDQFRWSAHVEMVGKFTK